MDDRPLESCSGHFDQLYYWLWKKDDQRSPCPNLLIPQTVTFRFQQPFGWFFSSVQDGQLKKKHKINSTIPNIIEDFEKLSGNNPSGVVATFVQTDLEGTVPVSTFRFLDMDELREMLNRVDRPASGVLQQFIEPAGGRNSIIRATWAPQLLILERRINKHSVTDRKASVYERMMTWEGALHHSDTMPVSGSTLPAHIQRVCRSVADHIAAVGGQRPRQMVLHFKVDVHDRLYLLYCSLFHVGPDTCPVQPTLTVPSKASLIALPFARSTIPQSPPGRPVRGLTPRSVLAASGATGAAGGMVSCVSCGACLPAADLYDISYKTVVAHFKRSVTLPPVPAATSVSPVTEIDADEDDDKENGDGAVEPRRARTAFATLRAQSEAELQEFIPPIIRTLHPALSYRRFMLLLKDPGFLYKCARVCGECCVAHNESAMLVMETSDDLVPRITPRDRTFSHPLTPALSNGAALNTARFSHLTAQPRRGPAAAASPALDSVMSDAYRTASVVRSLSTTGTEPMSGSFVDAPSQQGDSEASKQDSSLQQQQQHQRRVELEHRREVQRLLEQTRSLIAQGPGDTSPYAAGPAALADAQIYEARQTSPQREAHSDAESPSRRAASVADVRSSGQDATAGTHGLRRIHVPSLPPRASTVMGILPVAHGRPRARQQQRMRPAAVPSRTDRLAAAMSEEERAVFLSVIAQPPSPSETPLSRFEPPPQPVPEHPTPMQPVPEESAPMQPALERPAPTTDSDNAAVAEPSVAAASSTSPEQSAAAATPTVDFVPVHADHTGSDVSPATTTAAETMQPVDASPATQPQQVNEPAQVGTPQAEVTLSSPQTQQRTQETSSHSPPQQEHAEQPTQPASPPAATGTLTMSPVSAAAEPITPLSPGSQAGLRFDTSEVQSEDIGSPAGPGAHEKDVPGDESPDFDALDEPDLQYEDDYEEDAA